MPWIEETIMSQRTEFVLLAQHPDANISALCRRFRMRRTSATASSRVVTTISISFQGLLSPGLPERVTGLPRWVNFGRRFPPQVGHYCTPVHTVRYTRRKEEDATGRNRLTMLTAGGSLSQMGNARTGIYRRPESETAPRGGSSGARGRVRFISGSLQQAIRHGSDELRVIFGVIVAGGVARHADDQVVIEVDNGRC